jgi:hypothetical protein
LDWDRNEVRKGEEFSMERSSEYGMLNVLRWAALIAAIFFLAFGLYVSVTNMFWQNNLLLGMGAISNLLATFALAFAVGIALYIRKPMSDIFFWILILLITLANLVINITWLFFRAYL